MCQRNAQVLVRRGGNRHHIRRSNGDGTLEPLFADTLPSRNADIFNDNEEEIGAAKVERPKKERTHACSLPQSDLFDGIGDG